MSSGRFWMVAWLCVVILTIVQTVVFAITRILLTEVGISVMSIEALLLSAGAGFQATLSMRKADDKDPM